MNLAQSSDAPGEGERGRSRKHADPPPAGALDGATRRKPGGFGHAQQPRLPGAPPPALARGIAVGGQDR